MQLTTTDTDTDTNTHDIKICTFTLKMKAIRLKTTVEYKNILQYIARCKSLYWSGMCNMQHKNNTTELHGTQQVS